MSFTQEQMNDQTQISHSAPVAPGSLFSAKRPWEAPSIQNLSVPADTAKGNSAYESASVGPASCCGGS